MIPIEILMLKQLKELSQNNNKDFVHYVKMIFNVKEICLILEINRNRYYYLKRINKLDDEIIKKGEAL